MVRWLAKLSAVGVVALTTATLLRPKPLAAEGGSPDWCKSGWFCVKKEKAIVLRDKARAYEGICGLSGLPSSANKLCEYASRSAIWVAQAKKYREAQSTADKLSGRLSESRSELDWKDIQLRKSRQRAGKWRSRAKNKVSKWKASLWGVGGGVIGIGTGLLLGKFLTF